VVVLLGDLEVVDLVLLRLEPVVHVLWLFSFVEDESSGFSLDHLTLGDLVTFGHRLEHVPTLVCALQSLHLVILYLT
jgi:hypothetical protein